MFDYFLSVAIVLLVLVLNFVKVNVMLHLSVLPAKPTRVELFAVIVVRQTVRYFHGVWSLLSTRDFGMLCFSLMLTIRK